MDMIATCRKNLNRFLENNHNYSFLNDLQPEQVDNLLADVADKPFAVGPGNRYPGKVLLFNLENLREEVRRAFLTRLMDELAVLCRNLAPAQDAASGPDPQDQAASPWTLVAGPDEEGRAAEQPSALLPWVGQRRRDWFDRLMDVAEGIARGLGLV